MEKTYVGDGVGTRKGTGVGHGLASVLAGTFARELRLLE